MFLQCCRQLLQIHLKQSHLNKHFPQKQQPVSETVVEKSFNAINDTFNLKSHTKIVASSAQCIFRIYSSEGVNHSRER